MLGEETGLLVVSSIMCDDEKNLTKHELDELEPGEHGSIEDSSSVMVKGNLIRKFK